MTEHIVTKPSTPEYEKTWERVFGDKNPIAYLEHEGEVISLVYEEIKNAERKREEF